MKMHITFNPVRRDEALTLSKSGEVLTINGQEFDFGPLSDGSELPPGAIVSDFIAGPVRREGGDLHLSLVLPHGSNAPEAAKFPEPITADLDGPITLPPFDIVTDEEGNETEVYGEPVSVTSDGIIDWSLMTTPESRASAALQEWRESASLTRTKFCLSAKRAGLFTPDDALLASKGGWPEAFANALDELPVNIDPVDAQITWAATTQVSRMDPVLNAVAKANQITPEQVDQMFGWTT
jgi:hypothetical protein